MDEKGLREHWLIGVSRKRDLSTLPKGRKQIGKFGIGKWRPMFWLGDLTHICKVGPNITQASMDYSQIPDEETAGFYSDEKVVTLPLRVLTEQEAKAAVLPWLNGSKPGYKR